jgi:hypothetical protein
MFIPNRHRIFAKQSAKFLCPAAVSHLQPLPIPVPVTVFNQSLVRVMGVNPLPSPLKQSLKTKFDATRAALNVPYD